MSIGTVNATGAGRLTEQPAWKALEAHHQSIRVAHLRELFARDPGRGERLALDAAGVYLDYSKNRITDDTVALLVRLAEECGLRARIDAMFRGDRINVSENRAVLHVALRAPRDASILVDGKTLSPTCTPCSTGWRTLSIVFAAEPGPDSRGSGYAMSSTSASAVPISGR